MFKRLAKSWLAQSRRAAPGLRPAITHCNDNLPGFRRPAAAGKRRAPTPALACHWLHRDGRLECCWHLKTDDAPTGGNNEYGQRAASPLAPPGRRCYRAARTSATTPAVGT
jgi:hypothetical protein